MNKQLREFYLDWVNNYLTVETMAEQHELDVAHARTLIDMGRDAHQKYVDEVKRLEHWARLRRDYPAIERTK